MIKKNTAVDNFLIGNFIKISDGSEVVEGYPTAKRMVDGVVGDCDNSPVYDSGIGSWKINFTPEDLNGDVIGFKFSLPDCYPLTLTITTTEKTVDDINDVFVLDLTNTESNIINHGDEYWVADDKKVGVKKVIYTVTNKDNQEPIPGVKVWVTANNDITDNVIRSGCTDQDGEVLFYLKPGTYYLWRSKANINFVNPDVIEVVDE